MPKETGARTLSASEVGVATVAFSLQQATDDDDENPEVENDDEAENEGRDVAKWAQRRTERRSRRRGLRGQRKNTDASMQPCIVIDDVCNRLLTYEELPHWATRKVGRI